MKVLTGEQANVIIDDLQISVEQGIILREAGYVFTDRKCNLHLYLKYVSDLQVEYVNGFYKTVAVIDPDYLIPGIERGYVVTL